MFAASNCTFNNVDFFLASFRLRTAAAQILERVYQVRLFVLAPVLKSAVELLSLIARVTSARKAFVLSHGPFVSRMGLLPKARHLLCVHPPRAWADPV